MGIDVCGNRRVSFTDAHQNLVDTRSRSYIAAENLDGLLVYDIFKRRRARGVGKGDGNPLVYALKRMNGYSITSSELVKFLPAFRHNLSTVLTAVSFDVVVFLPSKSSISQGLARRASAFSNVGVEHDVFGKQRHRVALNSLPTTNHSDVISLRNILSKNSSKLISMKDIPTNLRYLVNPLYMKNNLFFSRFAGKRVLVVDDLLATGSSMRGAASLLLNGGCASVVGLCLFSSV